MPGCPRNKDQLSLNYESIMDSLDHQIRSFKELKRELKESYSKKLNRLDDKINSIRESMSMVEGDSREALKEKLRELESERQRIKEEREYYVNDLMEELQLLVSNKKVIAENKRIEDKRNNNLATQKGVCPFPSLCNKREYCTKDSCHAFRRS